MVTSLVNDQLSTKVSINNRGLAYGDGIFTTALVRDGQIVMLAQHIQRIQHHCESLLIDGVDLAQLTQQATSLSKTVSLGVLKIIVTAGDGGRGYSRIGSKQANVIITLHDYPTHYLQWQQQGIHLGVSTQRLGLNPRLAGLKHLNRLEQVLLRQELDLCDEDELLVMDINDHIVECCSANVFWCQAGQWFTPKLTHAGVAGIMRADIIAKLSTVIEDDFSLSALDNVDSMFISNAILGIVPVAKFQGNCLDIGSVEDIQLACLP